MDIPTITKELWLAIWTIITGVVASAAWDWIKENVTFSSSRWPRLSGEWSILHSDNSRSGEWAVIKQQFGPKFRGELYTPDPDSPEKIYTQVVRGELVDKYHALFTLRQKGGDFTEMGAGMITINANQITASGKSVFFGATAPEEGISTFSMTRR